MLKEITQYIEDNTSWVIGTDLYAGFRPEGSAVRCLVVLDNTGGRANYYLRDAGDKLVQVVSRSNDYFQAKEDLTEIHDLLHGASGITLPVVDGGDEYLANTIEALNLPQSIGQNDKGEWEFSVNFIFRYQKTS